MQCRRYQGGKDYEMIQGWAKDRAISFVPRTQLPARGYVVDDVACIFLFKTDSKVWLMDYFVTNPNADWESRKVAMDLGMHEMKKEAKGRGGEVLIAHSDLPSVLAYAEHAGGFYDEIPSYRVRIKL